MTDSPLIAAIYARQSHGKTASITQQIDESRAAAEEEGWPVVTVFQDGSSASRFSTKSRAGWEQLLTDLDARRFGVLVLWESSRGDRRLSTWAAMLELARDRDVRIYVVTHERLYDLNNARDWKALAEDGTDSAYESEKTSLRSRRNTAALAKSGRPHGMVAYGYKRVRQFDDRGRMVDSRDELVEEEAALIRDAARRLLRGESMRSIVKSFNEQGRPSPKGKEWSSTQLRQVMLRDRNAGLRTHRGVVVGKAAWDPIYDQGTHDRVVATLTDPTRLVGQSDKGATRKHLLSGLALCGRCGGPMRATPGTVHRGKTIAPRYQCKGCMKVARKQDLVDELVEGAAVLRLQEPDTLRALASGQPERAAELTKLIADAAAQLDRAVDKLADGVWTEAQVDRLNARLLPQIETWRTERAGCAPHDGLLDLIGEDARSRWDDAPLDMKRVALSLLMRVTVLPAGPGKRFDPDAVVDSGAGIEWADMLRIEWQVGAITPR